MKNLILTLFILTLFINTHAQIPYNNPAHTCYIYDKHIDYVVINKHIDSFMPIAIILTGFTINHIGGLNFTKKQHDIVGGMTLFLCVSYTVMMEFPIKRPNIKRFKKHKKL